MKLPFLVSVPHAGLQIPQEVQDICILTPEDIYADSDSGAAEIYYDLETSVKSFIPVNVTAVFATMSVLAPVPFLYVATSPLDVILMVTSPAELLNKLALKVPVSPNPLKVFPAKV